MTDSDVDAKLRALDADMQKSGGKSLEETLKANGVALATFREKTRGVVALERMARQDQKIPESERVESLHLKLWLKQARERTTIERDSMKLSPSVVSMVGGEPISREAFVRQLLVTLPANDIRKLLDTLIQDHLMSRELLNRQLSVSEADVEAQWEVEKKAFLETNPGVPFDEVVKQQSGLDPAAFKATRGFRIRAALGVLARRIFSAEAVAADFEKHQDLFGPRYTVRHILIGATESPSPRGKLPSFADALEKAKLALHELDQGLTFEDLAVKYSDDAPTKVQGGLLRTFTPGRNNFEKSFLDACLTLEPHQVSDPVKTRFGYHIIRCDKKEPAPPLAEVEDEVRRLMATNYFKAVHDALHNANKIGIDVPIR